ncbi:hypothetical protein MY04_1203 [Flammeovirga sp. MY04]|uniref:hypothetical protein n=1 Tax=Flammeovirga sp. MY04 TaxID=1191459 RepID=UPI0008062416|nr:hypothetical protein [Flammeovirga sp. MY04]ANQ48580.1 hypothetical protein MY04_1203 [Flammeovirga sp. MY04]
MRLNILFLLLFFPLLIQAQNQIIEFNDLTSIIVESQQSNEPHVKGGHTIYSLCFTKNENGDFISNEIVYQKDKKNKVNRLNNTITISKKAVETFLYSLNEDKSQFKLQDLGLAHEKLDTNINVDHSSALTFTKTINDDFLFDIDSFSYCNSFQSIKKHIIGGKFFTLKLLTKEGKETILDISTGDLNLNNPIRLRNYFIVYPMLKGKLPTDFFNHEYFNEDRLLLELTNYLKVIECEDYYYEEFKKQHPDRTHQENRMRVGWDFEEYFKTNKK